MNVDCIIFESLKNLADGNMALNINGNNILYFHLDMVGQSYFISPDYFVVLEWTSGAKGIDISDSFP